MQRQRLQAARKFAFLYPGTANLMQRYKLSAILCLLIICILRYYFVTLWQIND